MKRTNLILSMLMSTVLLAGCASTDSNSDAIAQAKTNFAQQNYQLAFKQIQAPANQGDPEAQYALGYMYYYGKGTAMNRSLGKEWIKKAADNGDSNAQQAYQSIVSEEQHNVTAPADTQSNATTTDTDSVASENPVTPPVSAAAPVSVPVAAVAATPIHHTAATNSHRAAVAGASTDEHAILAASGHQYTLQLTNAPSASAAKAFIKQHHLGTAAKYYRRQVNNNEVYTVIYGHYPSEHAAELAAHKLPASLQKSKPWPRTLSSVQAELRHS